MSCRTESWYQISAFRIFGIQGIVSVESVLESTVKNVTHSISEKFEHLGEKKTVRKGRKRERERESRAVGQKESESNIMHTHGLEEEEEEGCMRATHSIMRLACIAASYGYLLAVLCHHHHQLVHREIDASHLPPPAVWRGWNDVERERWVASPQHVRMHLRRRRMWYTLQQQLCDVLCFRADAAAAARVRSECAAAQIRLNKKCVSP